MRILCEQSHTGGAVLDLLGIYNCFVGHMTHKWRTMAANKKPHCHAIYEIHILQKGSLTYGQDDILYQLEPGDFLLIPPHTIHRLVSCSEDAGTVHISFRAELENCALPALSSVTFGTLTKRMQDTIDLLIAEDQKPTALHDQLMTASIWELLICLWRLCGAKTQTKYHKENEDRRIARAKQYITDNVELFPTVQEVAGYCHLSVRQLGRLFQQEEGISPNDYIKNQQLSRIRVLLRNSGLSLRHISERMNFTSESYFNRFFKQHTGITPGEYRSQKAPETP